MSDEECRRLALGVIHNPKHREKLSGPRRQVMLVELGRLLVELGGPESRYARMSTRMVARHCASSSIASGEAMIRAMRFAHAEEKVG